MQTLYYKSDGIVGYHMNGDVAKWDDVMPDLWAETPATDAYLAEVRAQVWIEAKALAKSAIASDSVDHIDFLFDGKASQLRQEVAQ